MIPRVETDPHGVETPIPPADRRLGHKSRDARGRKGPVPGSEIPPYIHNFYNMGTKKVISWIETAPHGVETPAPLTDR